MKEILHLEKRNLSVNTQQSIGIQTLLLWMDSLDQMQNSTTTKIKKILKLPIVQISFSEV